MNKREHERGPEGSRGGPEGSRGGGGGGGPRGQEGVQKGTCGCGLHDQILASKLLCTLLMSIYDQ
jgi:hypothetical protein